MGYGPPVSILLNLNDVNAESNLNTLFNKSPIKATIFKIHNGAVFIDLEDSVFCIVFAHFIVE